MKTIFLTVPIILIVWLTWKPFYSVDKEKGFITFYWSGLSALFHGRDFGIKTTYYQEVNFGGCDGPYLFQDSISQYIHYVTEDNHITSDTINTIDSLLVRVSNRQKDSFFVKPAEINKEESTYSMPKKLVVISDIEGNFNGLYSFLIANKVMDEKYEWTFKDGHIVILGDFVDRGTNVTQVLWLIYKLEKEAMKNGGKVHYILGNHEVMTLQGRPSYANEKYIKIAQLLSGKKDFSESYKLLYGSNSFLAKWLKSKNVIEKIGEYIFTHGGLSPKLIAFTPTLESINLSAKKNYTIDLYSKPSGNTFDDAVNGREGVFWFRGMAMDYKYYSKVTQQEFEEILNYFKAKKIIIGHTINEDIVTDFQYRLIKIDVLHGQEKSTGKTKGVLIENGRTYKIDDAGNKSEIH